MKSLLTHTWRQSLTALVGVLAMVGSAGAITIEIDTDPGTAGIQNMREVVAGDNFMVDVVVTGIPAPGLNGYEFDVAYDSSILMATGITSGGFVPVPFVVQNVLGPPEMEFAEVALAPLGGIGDGILASLSLFAFDVGMSDLDLNDVILSFPNGIPITDFNIFDGKITVVETQGGGGPVVPEPGSMLLMGTGIAGLIGWRWRQGKQ